MASTWVILQVTLSIIIRLSKSIRLSRRKYLFQNVIRNAKALNVISHQDNASENPESHDLVKKVILLGLLPWNNIEEGLNYINRLAKERSLVTKKWTRFLEKYFHKEWVEKITPRVFSTFNCVESTNDYFGEYFITVNGRIGQKSDPIRFLSKWTSVSVNITEKKIISGRGLVNCLSIWYWFVNP